MTRFDKLCDPDNISFLTGESIKVKESENMHADTSSDLANERDTYGAKRDQTKDEKQKAKELAEKRQESESHPIILGHLLAVCALSLRSNELSIENRIEILNTALKHAGPLNFARQTQNEQLEQMKEKDKFEDKAKKECRLVESLLLGQNRFPSSTVAIQTDGTWFLFFYMNGCN